MILKSGRITGLRESKGEVIGEANWEPILDRATWEQVRSRLTHAPIGRRGKVNLLAGMCRCAECGAVMAAASERIEKELKPGQRPPRRTLACDKANRHGCGSNTVKADYVEQIVIDYALTALEHTDVATARARRAGGDAHRLVASIETDDSSSRILRRTMARSGSTVRNSSPHRIRSTLAYYSRGDGSTS